MKLLLIRHGQTIENTKGIIQGQLDGTLSKKGIKQAEEIGKSLKNNKIDFIYSSDLKRALDTATRISNSHPNIPIIKTKELREMNLGEYQGKTIDEIGLSKSKGVLSAKKKGGETLKELSSRAKKFLNKIIVKHKDDTILLVGHSGINKAIISIIKKRSPEYIGR